MNNNIKKGAITSYITVAFNIISGFFFTPYLIGEIGSGNYGIYTLLTTFLNYFLVDFGLGNSVAKFVSEYRAIGEQKKCGEIVAVVMKLFFVIAIIAGCIIFALYFFVDDFFTGLALHEVLILKKMYVISGFTSVIFLLFIPLDGLMIAYELFFEQKIIELLRKVSIIIFSIISLSINNNVVLIVAINAIVGAFIIILKVLVVRKKTDLKVEWNYFKMSTLKKIASLSIWLTLITLTQRLIIPIAPTILGRFSNSREISYFSIAVTIEGYICSMALCLNGLFVPTLSRLYFTGRSEDINRLFIKVGKIQVIIIGLIVSTFFVFGKDFIKFWVGEEFISSYYVTILISASTIVVYAQQIANTLLMIEQNLKYKFICYFLGAMISMIISCILTPSMGAIGAGIGVAICLWISQVIGMNIIYSRITRLDITAFFKQCYLIYCPIISGLGIISFFIYNYISSLAKTPISLFVGIFIFVIAYFVLLWKFYLNKDEKSEMINLIKNH